MNNQILCISFLFIFIEFIKRCDGQRGWFPSDYVEIVEEHGCTEIVLHEIHFYHKNSTLFI
jgi:hypothetical protein